ncbi:hypothetical protein RND71_017929 [Anisodus tanguticus]|uniref:Uncharacterized protein n=1 Tax=Anisodus tanguticus TaxID=243964 RepID=A0AAE1S4N5_9SOLA|nr:hypothetical protein RND71_017929 [Anisodus tanguticus]
MISTRERVHLFIGVKPPLDVMGDIKLPPLDVIGDIKRKNISTWAAHYVLPIIID